MHVATMLRILNERTGRDHCLKYASRQGGIGKERRLTFYSEVRSPDGHGKTHGVVATDAVDQIVGTFDGLDEYLAETLGCSTDKRSVVRALHAAALPCEARA